MTPSHSFYCDSLQLLLPPTDKVFAAAFTRYKMGLGCALTFASEAKFEIEAKILFRLEAKKMPDFT